MFKIIFAFIFGYIIYKGIQFFRTIFSAVKNSEKQQNVKGTKNPKSKIDKKDVIDAQFEEIEVKDNSSTESK